MNAPDAISDTSRKNGGTATLAALASCSAEILAPNIDETKYESVGTCFLVDVIDPDDLSRRFALTAHHCVVESQSLDKVASLRLRFPDRELHVKRIAATSDFLRENDLALLELASDPELPALPCLPLGEEELVSTYFLVRGCASGMRTQFSNFRGTVVGVEHLRAPLSGVSLIELSAESFAHNLLKGISGAPICALMDNDQQTRLVVIGVVREVASRDVATSRFYGSGITSAEQLARNSGLEFRHASRQSLMPLQTSSLLTTRGPLLNRADASEELRKFRLYLESIISRWNYKTSPLLPADVAFPAVAVDLELRSHEAGRPLLPEYSRDTYPLTLSRRIQLEALLLDELSARHLSVLGDPGSGKTTLLQMVAARFASRAVDNPKAPLPIFISLAEFSVALADSPTWSLVDALEAQLGALGLKGPARFLHEAIEEGHALLLLDGYDEVADNKREPVLERLLAPLRVHKQNCIVVSSRKVGFRSIHHFERLEIAPLTVDQQKQLLIEICGADQCAIILRFLAGNSDFRDLAAIPLTLTILAVVAREYGPEIGPLLESRCELLRTAVQLLLEGRHRGGAGTRDPAGAESILADLSFALHDDRTAHEVYTARNIESRLTPLLRPNTSYCPWQNCREFLADISTHSGILAPIDSFQRQYRYLHRWFREYLAALAISKVEASKLDALVLEKVNDTAWSEVLVLFAGMSSRPNDFLSTLLTGSRGMALRALAEVQNIDVDVALKIIQLPPGDLRERRNVFRQLNAMLTSSEVIRLLKLYVDSAGRTIPRCDLYFIHEILTQIPLPGGHALLVRLFDHLDPPPDDLLCGARIPTGTVPYWCFVKGGPFDFGAAIDDPLKPSWVPATISIETKAFAIGVVPITFGLYWLFDSAHAPPANLAESVAETEIALHPVVNVSWYEAVVFCRWLNQAYPGVRLPNEYEWERAASWDEKTRTKYRFPWGNDWDERRLNSWHTGPNRSTPVGSYPLGAAPCGALDMAGNVWEWCANWFFEDDELDQLLRTGTAIPDVLDDGRFRKVDRGGGWYHDVGTPASFLRAADDPADRFSHCGFRLVRDVAEAEGVPVAIANA